MGTPKNGDSGPFDELPELPPDVRIPDDAAELAEEAAQVRRELREERVGGARASRLFTGGGFRSAVPASRRSSSSEPATLRIPLLIMTAALLAAVVSLFAAAWPDERRSTPPSATAPSGAAATTGAARAVPALDLVDEQGATVSLRSLLPAALILNGECACTDAITSIAGAVPAGVTVIAVNGAGAPSPGVTPTPGLPAAVRRLRDPTGALADFLGPTPSPAATNARVALVSRSGDVARVLDTNTPISAYAADLAFLPSR